ncbi:MAG: DUF2283 domain-containing protein [Patescibacteria group bacterium]
MKKVKKIQMSYEPEADVLSVKVAKKPIDYASEMGNVIVHFSKSNEPVLFEILNAKVFLSQGKSLVSKKHFSVASLVVS